MAQVILRDVSKVYANGVKAVDGVNLTIGDREFVVLVGPSGCGKSTTLRMVAGLEDISGGEIRIGERIVNDVAPKDRDIAMVFQNYALYPHMTVYQNMAFALRLRRRHKGWANPLAMMVAPARYRAAREELAGIDRRVRDAAAMLGIENLLSRRPQALSGGQRQRVAVGRAIVREPKAFLFDEPLSNLDAKLRIEMRAEIKRLHRRVQTTTIYVTHDQEEAMTLGDRVVVMKDGMIHQVGSPLEVYERPANRFVAGFVGTPPMNFFEGALVAVGGGLTFDMGFAKLAIAPRHQVLLEKFAGRPLVMGARPETLHLVPVQCGQRFPAHVTVTEPLGDRVDVYFDTPGQKHLVCRVDSRHRAAENQPADIHVEMDRVHFFNPVDQGRSVLRDVAT
ncbi:MAG: sn-glycerol-3-phosphate ABC transporter ATP-binding protein UgpC [Phycisphaerales bacterium]|nr:sn-glycerol-3-phosphate ABC transporter ATP-binding protein UgpC [Phycisphaerales bacterium]